jgi:hypothetical protein
MLFETLNIDRLRTKRYFAASCIYSLLLFTLSSCSGYQNSPGKWVPIEASALYFSGVELADDAITSGYRDTCIEAQQEIEKELIKRLPALLAPLKLYTAETPPAANSKTAELKILITQCDIDVDQYGGSFSYYLSLPLRISLTVDNQTLLDTSIKTYEQLQTDVPNPIYEFTFAEAVARTLLLFKGKQVWVGNDSLPDSTTMD